MPLGAPGRGRDDQQHRPGRHPGEAEEVAGELGSCVSSQSRMARALVRRVRRRRARGRARARRVAGAARRAGPQGCRCRDRARRCDAPRRGRAPRLADHGAALARGLARPRDAPARRLPRLAARRPGSRRGGLPLARVRGRLVFRRAHRSRGGRPGGASVAGAVRGLRVAPLHALAPAGSRRAGPQPCVHTGVQARKRLGCAVPPGGAGRAGGDVGRRGPGGRLGPEDFIAAMRARIEGWNELGRGLCRAFLAAT